MLCIYHFPGEQRGTSSSTCGVREFGLFAKHSTVREGFKPTTGLIQDTVVACRVSPAHDNAIIKKREEAKGRRAALPSLFSLRVIPASGKTFFFFLPSLTCRVQFLQTSVMTAEQQKPSVDNFVCTSFKNLINRDCGSFSQHRSSHYETIHLFLALCSNSTSGMWENIRRLTIDNCLRLYGKKENHFEECDENILSFTFTFYEYNVYFYCTSYCLWFALFLRFIQRMLNFFDIWESLIRSIFF